MLQFQCEFQTSSGLELNDACERVGPFFSSLNQQACDVYGGVFCPTTDCTDLKTCVESYQNEYEEPLAYADWLKLSPLINDASSSLDCGDARQYFGYDPNFVNDEHICDDVRQLRFSRDFAFLDNFFNQGDDDADGDADPSSKEIPRLVLEHPIAGKNVSCS